MKLLVFAASHRPDSYNRKLAQVAASCAKTHGASVDFAEYADFDMPVYNDSQADLGNFPPATHSFLNRAEKSDGIIIASPEYNWSYPGSLKNIIDWSSRINRPALKHKTVLLLSATPSARGGIIALDHLRSPLSAIHLHVFNRAFPLAHCEQAFDPAGNLVEEKSRTQLDAITSDFVTFTRKLANQ